VGFPGETEDEFGETLALVEAVPLTYLHVFAYSDRPGTRASRMEGKVPPERIAERSERLRARGSRKNDAFQTGFAGRTLRALVLQQRADDGRLVALTGNYLEVLLRDADDRINELVTVHLVARQADGRWDGRIV
jgi:threonylcarbamoyladenosine tRNA methylthiotransferase MtaB